LRHFDIRPEYDLDIMTPRQTPSQIAARAIEGVDRVISEVAPDLVLVHGDTTTTLAASMAAYHRKVALGHVEAGLRTGDKYAPFPEEMNRRLADAICDLHFAPTAESKQNLLREAIDEKGIFVTGNTAVDALLWTVKPGYRFLDNTLATYQFPGTPVIAVEVHRRENWGEPMHRLGRALKKIALDLPVRLIVSVHRNPEVREVVPQYLEGLPNVMLHDPFEYPDWANLMSRSRLIITDSGGLQEEAPSLGVPVLVCREKTERPEAVCAGTVKLTGTDEALLFDCTRELMSDGPEWLRMSRAKNPYGDGKAAVRTVDAISYYFGFAPRPEDHSCI
jgi:UDP-N-acetylglucosamine 2-epimerase (non-hydrolysing)